MKSGTRLGGVGGNHSGSLALLLILIAVLVPTAGVLWFMTQAVNQQRDVTRQRLSEAYRSQLVLLRDHLDSFWEKRARELAKPAYQESPAVIFEKDINRGLVDSAIYLNADGSIAYPSSARYINAGLTDRVSAVGFIPNISVAPSVDPTDQNPAWSEARALEIRRETLPAAAAAYARIASTEKNDSLVARALQAQIRCLVQSGAKEAAAAVIQRQFGKSRFARVTDLQGRIIAADEQLLLLNLLTHEDRRYLSAARTLHTMLADYEHWGLPSAQRLFLMEEMRALKLENGLSEFSTYNAEALAARFLENDRGRAGDPVLRPTGTQEIWKLTSTDARVIGLFRSETVSAAMRHFLDEQDLGKDVLFSVISPGAKAPPYDEGIPAGPRLPGWQLTLAIKNGERFDAMARRQVASYVWIGFLLITAMAVVAIITAQALRRQMRLASLKTDLVAAVSHELKTPLASMRLLVDSLLDDAALEPKKTREYLELVAQENSRLSRLIDNFLTFSRIERGRQSFAFAPTMPESIVGSAVEAAGERFRVADCRLEVEIESGLSPLHADADGLITVLLNLLDNAYKFTPQSKRIGVRAYSASGCICFEVTDNGIGLTPREQKKIFRRFYQVDRQLARQSGGVGLGLSIVEFIVKAHGGEIQVRSFPGAGSTFIVSLPLAAPVQSHTTAQQGAAI